MAPAASTGAPAQPAQSSRKSKKAWRKNVDLREVEHGLDVVRDEIIKGGVIAEKPSAELFTLDTAGSTAIRETVAKKFKPLKADQIIAARSAVPAVSARVPRGVTDGVLEPATKKRRSGVSRAEYERLRLRAFGGEAVPKDVVRADNVAEYDPWDQGAERAEEADFSFLDPVRPAKAPGTLRMKPVSLLEGDKVLPAVAKPQGGLSYNPVFEEWDSLIEREGEKEVEAERRRMAAAKAEQEQQAKIAAALAEDEEAWRTEDESVWEGFESEKSTEVHLPAKLPKRKTPVERNKAKRRKQREQAERYAQGMKRTGMRVVGSKVQREAAAAEKAAAEIGDAPQTGEEEAVQSSDDEIDERLLRRRRLGKHRLPEKELELVLPDELQDSLRLLKPEGNLLKDRFRSMMIRGKLETRRPLPQQKKAKRYETEKWSYKDWTLPGISV